ncbi:hypothetical protein [Streptomyces sp. NPDC057509]|uniref:hypothetical protein n=1 Tax=Streptomyces sp. NPDC057509 TaxID=3346152 RepID=UPI0036AA1B60
MSARAELMQLLTQVTDTDQARTLVDLHHAEVTAEQNAGPVHELTPDEQQFLRFALELAADQMAVHGDEFDAADDAALESLRRLTGEVTPAPDFYQPGYTYSDTDPEWRFRCDSVTTHPEDGERTALGWRFFRGEWDAIAYGEDDWDLCKFDGRAATGVSRG